MAKVLFVDRYCLALLLRLKALWLYEVCLILRWLSNKFTWLNAYVIVVEGLVFVSFLVNSRASSPSVASLGLMEIFQFNKTDSHENPFYLPEVRLLLYLVFEI